MNLDPTALLNQLMAVGRVVPTTLGVIAFAVGLFCIFRGGHLCAMGKEGRGIHDEVPVLQVVGYVFVGAMFIQFSRTVNMTVEMLGGAGTEVRSAMTYMAANSGPAQAFTTLVVATLTTWLFCFGLLGAFRGLLIWLGMFKGMHQGDKNPFVGGLVHLLGGALLINMSRV